MKQRVGSNHRNHLDQHHPGYNHAHHPQGAELGHPTDEKCSHGLGQHLSVNPISGSLCLVRLGLLRSRVLSSAGKKPCILCQIHNNQRARQTTLRDQSRKGYTLQSQQCPSLAVLKLVSLLALVFNSYK